MYKRQLNAAVLRANPIICHSKTATKELNTLQCRQFHVSPSGLEAETKKPLTRAAKKHIETTNAIQNIYTKNSRPSNRPRPAIVGAKPTNNTTGFPLNNAIFGNSIDLRAMAATPTRAPIKRRVITNPNAPAAGISRPPRPGLLPRPKKKRAGGDGKKEGGGRSRRGGFSGAKAKEEPWRATDQEKAYFDAKLLQETTPKPFQPSNISVGAFEGLGPVFPITQRGHAETLERTFRTVSSDVTIPEAVRVQTLAKQLVGGKYVTFRSDEERDAVLASAMQLVEEKAEKKSEEKGQVIEAEKVELGTLSEEQKGELVQVLLQGKYREAGTSPSLVDHVGRMARRNESYRGGQESALAKKIRSLAPATRAPPRKAAVAK